MTAPIRSQSELPMVGEILASVRNYADLIDAFRTIQARLGLTNANCDELGNMAEGQTDKCLGPTSEKTIGPLTFNRFCWMFAVKFEMVIDIDQMKVMQQYWEDRQRERPLYPHADVKRISKKLIERAKPHVFKDSGRLGGIIRSHLLSPKQRSEIASKAAKAKHRKRRREARATARRSPCATVLPVLPSSPGRR